MTLFDRVSTGHIYSALMLIYIIIVHIKLCVCVGFMQLFWLQMGF